MTAALAVVMLALICFLGWELNSTLRQLLKTEIERDALWDELHGNERREGRSTSS